MASILPRNCYSRLKKNLFIWYINSTGISIEKNKFFSRRNLCRTSKGGLGVTQSIFHTRFIENQKILFLNLTQQTQYGEELSNEIQVCSCLGRKLALRTEVDGREGDG